MEKNTKKGFFFKTYEAPFQSPFDKLFEIFKELITHTSGDFDEAIDWLRQLDVEYKLTDENYTIDDFIEDLKRKGYIREELKDDGTSGTGITAKTERAIRQQALDQIFGNLNKSGSGNHKTKYSGTGDEQTGEFRAYHFGDGLDRVSLTESLRNAQINNGVDEFHLTENDLVVEDAQFKAQMSTVLMIDISHSMILYGEDRITPAKKVAMALAELITTRYPKDTIDFSIWKRCLAYCDQRFALSKSRAVPHQYGGWLAIGNGHAAPKTQYQQANLYDYRWQAELCSRKRRQLLHEFQRLRRVHCRTVLQSSGASSKITHTHNYFYDCQRPVFAKIRQSIHRSKPR